jgi:hypothetical protein
METVSAGLTVSSRQLQLQLRREQQSADKPTTHVRHSDAETSEWTPGTAASVVTVWNVEWRHCHTINVNLIINNCIIIIL